MKSILIIKTYFYLSWVEVNLFGCDLDATSHQSLCSSTMGPFIYSSFIELVHWLMEVSNSQITIRRINIILAVNERQNILIPKLVRRDIHQIFVSCECLGYFNKKIALGVREVETSSPFNPLRSL